MPTPPKPAVFVVSDGRGVTGSEVLNAALVQFDGQELDIVVRPEVRTPEHVHAVVAEAAARDACIFYTLVSEDTRWALVRKAEELLVRTVDVLGPAFSALHDIFQSNPSGTPGLFYASDRERFDRQTAIDYTLTHDDGQRPHELDQADVVLVGVSRAAKSTTCFALAFKGIKAANVPLLNGQPPLPQLTALDPARVLGLNVNVSRLISVRAARASHLSNRHVDYYTTKQDVLREVRHAKSLMHRHGWRSIETSYLAVEEIAREVVRAMAPWWKEHDRF
jgi:regulator of PEP synthase PpsR (kinase-PPPase family)